MATYSPCMQKVGFKSRFPDTQVVNTGCVSSTAQRSAQERIQLHFVTCYFQIVYTVVVFYNIYTLSNLDFVNFSARTKTSAAGPWNAVTVLCC